MLKLRCINDNNVVPGLLTVGKDYEISEPWKGLYTVNECSVSLSNFENPVQLLKRLHATANKMIIPKPQQGETVEILITDNYIICYTHTKGNHWNISGNHWRYYHNKETGEYIPEHKVGNPIESVHIKQRLLKLDYTSIVNAKEIH